MATIAELELELGKERRAASREARIARGLAATKPMKLDTAQQKRLLRLYQQGEPVSDEEFALLHSCDGKPPAGVLVARNPREILLRTHCVPAADRDSLSKTSRLALRAGIR